MHRVTSSFPRADNLGSVSGTGPLFIAYLFSWGLYGVLCVQAYVYYLAFPRDKQIHKWLVASVYLIESVDIVFLTYDALSDFRNVFGLPVSRSTSLPTQFSWLRMYIFGGVVTALVQFYYAYHLHSLGRSRVPSFAIFLSALTQGFAGFVAGAIQSQHNFYVTATQTRILAEVYIFGFASAVCSVFITFFMAQHLLWTDTEWQKRHPLLPKVVRISFETGLAAALAAVTYVALFFCDVHPLTLMIPALLLDKIYANSFLLALNSRMYIAQGRVLPVGLSESALYPGSPIGSAVFGTQAKHVDVAVQVTRQTMSM